MQQVLESSIATHYARVSHFIIIWSSSKMVTTPGKMALLAPRRAANVAYLKSICSLGRVACLCRATRHGQMQKAKQAKMLESA